MNKTRKPDFRGEKSAFYSHHIGSGYMIKGEVWMEKDGRVFIDSNRINLLCLVDKFGSLAAAARCMGLCYNSAWLWVMDMNCLSPYPLVERASGGINGGYSKLTEQGHKIIDEYNKLNSKFKKVSIKTVGTELRPGPKPHGKEFVQKPEARKNEQIEPFFEFR